MKYYLVENKSDDYNNCLMEFVRTTEDNANQYYNQRAVSDADAEVLMRYFDLVDYDEENDRTKSRRYYGYY